MNIKELQYTNPEPSFLGSQGTNKAAIVSQELLAHIVAGVYQPGDKLPPERELAQRFGVSRTVIREALAALRIAGVVESRPGDGTYVKVARQSWQKSRELISELFQKGDPMEAWRAREVLEPCLARLAAENATLDDVKRLFAAVERMKTAVYARVVPDFYKADRDFHLALVAATHNAYLVAVVNPLLDWIAHPIWWEIKSEIEKELDPFLISLELHTKIARNIANHDAVNASNSTREHFVILARYLVATRDEKEGV